MPPDCQRLRWTLKKQVLSFERLQRNFEFGQVSGQVIEVLDVHHRRLLNISDLE